MTDNSNLPSVANAELPASYENARQALATCSSIDECQAWADKAKALASYAKQAQDESLRKLADRIKVRAVSRTGELLKQIEPARGGDRGNQYCQREGDLPLPSRTQAAQDAGMSEHQKKQALQVANVPRDSFEAQVESDNPPTITALAEQGRQRKNAVDLQGRDADEFNKALHFVAMFDRHLKALSGTDFIDAASILDEKERKKLRKIINEIDSIHDQVITRI
jgi:hypothetical protein